MTDLDRIVELERKTFSVGPYTKTMLRRMFSTHQSFNIVAVDSDRIAGYVVAIPLDDFSADVESIAVDPDYQRSGVGSQLMVLIEDDMKRRGFRTSVLEVRDRNWEAISFYKKHGYEISSFIPRYYREYFRGSRGAFRMTKELTA